MFFGVCCVGRLCSGVGCNWCFVARETGQKRHPFQSSDLEFTGSLHNLNGGEVRWEEWKWLGRGGMAPKMGPFQVKGSPATRGFEGLL